MGLQGKEWLTRYDSRINNITTEFFIPALSESTVYRRIAGLFSSTSFALAARGIKELILNSGSMQLIVCPVLTHEDIQAIKETSDLENMVQRSLKSQLDKIDSEFEKKHVEALKLLLKEGFLEIRVEIPKDSFGFPLDVQTIMKTNALAEKRGIFQDRDGHAISFRGPINESKESWEKGTHEITVDVDWIEGQRQHVLDDIRIFENKWNDKDTLPLPKTIREHLVKTAPPKDEIDLDKFDYPNWAYLPNGDVLWPHQIRAVNAWLSNDYQGIFSMATGSGKTLTALSAVGIAPKNMMVLIIAYGKTLVRQWEKEVRKYDSNADIVMCDSDTNWKMILPGKLVSYLKGSEQYNVEKRLYVIATPQTASMEIFQRNFENIDSRNLQLIADEVHHLGSEEFSRVFNIAASRRIGLSATYRRDWDESGTQDILDYFGRALEEAKYGISEAIKDGRLCKYKYFPYFAYLSADEFEEYVELSLQIKQEFARLKVKESSVNLPVLPRRLEQLLRDRAEKLKKCRDKPRTYKEIVAAKPKMPYVVFADDKQQAAEIEQAHKEEMQELSRKLGEVVKDDMMIFSGELDDWQREKILAEAKLRATPLLAMYCLDEGVDVPELKSAIIVSSSASKRQYIQRRGRILRLGERGKVAELYDIIVLPRPDPDPVRNEIAREAIIKERERLEELSNDAENRYDVLLKFDKERERLGFGYIV